jgi:hypothetical protein
METQQILEMLKAVQEKAEASMTTSIKSNELCIEIYISEPTKTLFYIVKM